MRKERKLRLKRMAKVLDLTGQKFGKLTVLSRAPDKISQYGHKTIRWNCMCDCQRDLPKEEQQIHIVPTDRLRAGKTKSCGNCPLHNYYDLSKEYGIGYDINHNEFYFDKEDYEWIKKYPWHIKSTGYVETNNFENQGFTTLHRIIMGLDKYDNRKVDHINHNRADNRRCNLRIATDLENGWNIGVRKNNLTGVTGVQIRENGKWRAFMSYKGKSVLNKTFNTFEEAVAARKKVEEKYYGEWSYDNSIKISEKFLIKGE